jgi:transposase-like protein
MESKNAPSQRKAPKAGVDYPRNYAEFLAWYPAAAACLDDLDWIRWKDGFECPSCHGSKGWRMKNGKWWCDACRNRVSSTAGTIFHHARTPLTVWFAAAWHLTAANNGVSAKTLHRILGVGAYPTAWAMLHRSRCAISHAGHDMLSGHVEVDETVLGGARHGKRGRGAEGKVLVAVAVELLSPKGFGRCRLQIIPNAETETLKTFIQKYIKPGSTIYTDGLISYPSATQDEYIHQGTSIKGSGKDANEVLPGVHRVAALVKRWLMGTHQGSFEEDHLQAYLDEVTFRFNRRTSAHRGRLFFRLIEQCVARHPMPFRELVANPKPKNDKQEFAVPSSLRNKAPASLDISVPTHPGRTVLP